MASTKRTPALDSRRSGALVADAIGHRVLNALTESEQDDSSSNSEHLLGSLASASQLPNGGGRGQRRIVPRAASAPVPRQPVDHWTPEVQRLLGTAEIASR